MSSMPLTHSDNAAEVFAVFNCGGRYGDELELAGVYLTIARAFQYIEDWVKDGKPDANVKLIERNNRFPTTDPDLVAIVIVNDSKDYEIRKTHLRS